jgi:Tol biopolymer transport system component
MTDRLDFEVRLEERLKARAATASRPFDAGAIAHSVVAADGARRSIGRFPAFTGRPVSILVMAGLLIALAFAAVLVVGALRMVPPVPPVPPPFGNGWIAVSANPTAGGGEAGDIYRVEADGRAVRVIGSDGDGVAQACPRFSPDGRVLAYGEARASDQPVTNQRGNWPVRDRAVVLVHVDTDGDVVPAPALARIDVATEAGEIVCPIWSPDGRFVAFRVGLEIRVADVGTGELRVFPVTRSSSSHEGFAWSHDGGRLAAVEPRQILVIHLDGAAPEQIPVPLAGAASDALGWTAGDKEIVYDYDAVDSGDGHPARAVDVATMQDRELTRRDALGLDVSNAAVSPDGTRMAWIGSTLNCRLTGDRCTSDKVHLQTMDLGTGAVSDVAVPAEFVIAGLQWSPDGERLLMSGIDRLESVAVYNSSPAVIHTRGQLDLEWSWDEISWQPLVR